MGQRKGEIMSNIDKYEARKKMVYDFMCDDMYVPMKIKELCIVLGVKKEDRPQLEQILLDLQAEGRITLSKRGKYSKSEIKKTVGVFTAHQRGFGFVTVEGEPDDIFIPAEYVNGAMHMDTVEITISPVTTGRRKEGKVVSVIERGMKQVVCTYEASDNFGFAVPDNTRFGTDIFIPKERSKGAMSGHKVVVEITSYGKKGKKPEGKVVEIIGHIDDPGTDILSIVKALDLFRTFHITPKISNSFDDLVSIYVSSSSGIGVSVIPTSVAAYTSNEYTDSYLIDDADTSIAYVMAWGKNISNPAAKLFMEAVKKYAKGDDNIYGL